MTPDHHACATNESTVHSVTTKDLPLCCPMPTKEQWDSHPKIYLPIASVGQSICPYCGTIYQLVQDQVSDTTT